MLRLPRVLDLGSPATLLSHGTCLPPGSQTTSSVTAGMWHQEAHGLLMVAVLRGELLPVASPAA